MNFDMLRFAVLVSWVSSHADRTLELYDIEQLQDKVRECFITPIATQDYSKAYEVRELFRALADGRKIEAIKLYRSLTGDGLVESKQVCESVRSA